MSLQIDTILFDLDGTLVDTELAAARAVELCFREWGHAVTHEDALYVTGRTWAMAFEYLARKYPLPLATTEAARIVIDRYRQELDEHLHFVPGSAECVHDLAGAGFRIGLVSGSHRREIFFALEKLGVRDRFEVVLGAEDYPRSKPAPDGYLKALRMLGADSGRTLIFEDSEPGIASALAAGAWVTAISSTNHFRQDHTAAHWVVRDLTSVNASWVRALRAPSRGTESKA